MSWAYDIAEAATRRQRRPVEQRIGMVEAEPEEKHCDGDNQGDPRSRHKGHGGAQANLCQGRSSRGQLSMGRDVPECTH